MSTVSPSHSPTTSRPPSRCASPRLMNTPRRPKVMRSSATAPSLVTSYASRNDLADRQTSRAAMILNRFASHGETRSQQSLRRSLSSARRSTSPKQYELNGHEVIDESSLPKDSGSADSEFGGSYFSFPSFEYFEDVQKGKLNQDSQPHLETGSLDPMSR